MDRAVFAPKDMRKVSMRLGADGRISIDSGLMDMTRWIYRLRTLRSRLWN